MSSKMPPIPPANRNEKAPDKDQVTLERTAKSPVEKPTQGHQANIRQNTTHQGYQQDR